MPAKNDRMPITAHLEEFRKRLLRCIIALAVGFGLTFSYSEDILEWMLLPIRMTMGFDRTFPFFHPVYTDTAFKLSYIDLTEPFWMHMKIAFVAGIFLAMPFILTQVWLFISPGLLPKERRYALPFVVLSSAMFVLGALFAQYFMLPFAVHFLIGYKTENLVAMVTIGKYTDFVSKFLLATGLVFELPLVITLLSKLGIVSPEFLAKNRKYAVLIAFVVSALITPTSDIFNLLLMAAPILVLYEVGILMARLVGRRKMVEDDAAGGSDLTPR
ncbi:MAG: twin-arginine translocase subunit TatC [Nitrospirae bacterium]|nr:twin-arginine translocase subunit TatC [Nitrospirota bacterium]